MKAIRSNAIFHHPPTLTCKSELSMQLDGRPEETQRLESLYQRKLAALEALKKSLLHRAFTGKL